MSIREDFQWPEEKARLLRRATRLEITTLFWMTTIIVAVYFAMGSSQAMRTAWFEDILGLVPATAFLVARHFEKRPPDRDFPFGYFKAVTIAYLVAATALVSMALYMIYDSVMGLAMLDRPSIGLVEIAGFEFWSGWLMIAVLIYSMVPPVILGRMKMPLGRALHDRVLMADAAMQKADWMTAGAAIVGILLVGFGIWWADAVAAIVIALDVMHDGVRHLGRAVADLADNRPQKVDSGDPDPVVEQVRHAMLALDWVEEAELRMRDEGHVITGTILLTPTGAVTRAMLADARAAARAAHWRVHDPVVTLTEPSPPH